MSNRNGQFIRPRDCAGYPLDLDGSLRFTREATGYSVFPYPTIIGYVQGLLPMQDNLVHAAMYGKQSWGPWSPGAAPQSPAGASLAFVGEQVGNLNLLKVDG